MGQEAYGSLTMSCTFDAAGVVQACEPKPSKGSDFSKKIVACMQKSLAKLHLDPKTGDPAKCTAQIEFQIKHGKIHRKYRCTSPDDPLCGL